MRGYLLGVLILSAPTFARADTPPNIVYIISDDHGADDYGFRGHPHLKTPNIDRLAAESLVYMRGYVTSSVCCPSLASLLTGLYPHQSKITSNDPPFARVPKKSPATNADYLRGRQWYAEQMKSLPSAVRLLRSLGYLSLQTGKWWHGHFSTGGFTHGMSLGDPKKQGRHGDEGLTIGRQSMAPVFDFIKEAKAEKKPFFVWYAPFLPHTPHNAPAKYLEPYKNIAPSPTIAKYYANVAWLDDTVGQLLDFLDKNGLTENTIVVYVCDNGWAQDPKTGLPVRTKLTQYDAGHRTPIMIRWPGKVSPAKSEVRVSAVDIVPTLLKAAGAPIPAEMTGINLLDEKAVKNRTAIYGECFTHDAVDLENPAANLRWRWMIEDNWRVILPNPTREPKAVVELYNLAIDPNEQTNLASREPDRVRAMRAKVDAWWSPTSP